MMPECHTGTARICDNLLPGFQAQTPGGTFESFPLPFPIWHIQADTAEGNPPLPAEFFTERRVGPTILSPQSMLKMNRFQRNPGGIPPQKKKKRQTVCSAAQRTEHLLSRPCKHRERIRPGISVLLFSPLNGRKRQRRGNFSCAGVFLLFPFSPPESRRTSVQVQAFSKAFFRVILSCTPLNCFTTSPFFRMKTAGMFRTPKRAASS